VLIWRQDLQQRVLMTGEDKVTAMASSMRNDMDTTLSLGHAGLTSECWPGARRAGSDAPSKLMASLRRPALRLRRPARPHTRRCPRPSYPAEARLTAEGSEYLTV